MYTQHILVKGFKFQASVSVRLHWASRKLNSYIYMCVCVCEYVYMYMYTQHILVYGFKFQASVSVCLHQAFRKQRKAAKFGLFVTAYYKIIRDSHNGF